jgi:hypothetical protein
VGGGLTVASRSLRGRGARAQRCSVRRKTTCRRADRVCGQAHRSGSLDGRAAPQDGRAAHSTRPLAELCRRHRTRRLRSSRAKALPLPDLAIDLSASEHNKVGVHCTAAARAGRAAHTRARHYRSSAGTSVMPSTICAQRSLYCSGSITDSPARSLRSTRLFHCNSNHFRHVQRCRMSITPT